MKTQCRQMSESMIVGLLLALAGGFMDAYTYLIRGNVFANAQTGNIVLLGIHLMNGEWHLALYYLVPIVSFVGGVVLVLTIRNRLQTHGLHWRQVVLALEIVLMLIVSFFPQSCNMQANVLVSFTCAMQVECFRKIRGVACATTMCTGNLRSGTELLWNYCREGDPELKRRSTKYFIINFVFVIGAMLGACMTHLFAERAMLAVCVLLGAAFFAMFWEKDIF